MSLRRAGIACVIAFFLLGFSATLASCGGPTYVLQHYEGPQRSAETIALIRINGKDPIIWDSLDGESSGSPRMDPDSRWHIEVLPGQHTLGLRDQQHPSDFSEHVSFRAEAGKVYRPVLSGGSIRIYEVDRDSDAVLRDVTAPPRAPTEAPPSPPPKLPSAPARAPAVDAAPSEPPPSADGG